jgi:parallel beta-helix repeat protein
MTKSARSMVGTVMALGLCVALTPTPANALSHIVNPGESIQDAIDAASPGDVVKVNPGDYTEMHGNSAAILITKPLKLIARNTKTENVRILPGPGNTDGIVVRGTEGAPVERVLIKGFTIEGFSNNGIWLEYARKFKIKNNVSANNLENGIWPTLSARGLVKNNVAYGAEDSGLWVEASESVRVIKNELYNNPTGLELTISKKILAKGNNVHDNTVGVGLYHPNGAGLVSPYPYEDLGDWRIIRNTIVNNNFPNPVSGGLVGDLVPGIGALVIGVDDVLMAKNEVHGNGLTGIAVTDWCNFNDCGSDPVITEDKVDDDVFVKNTSTGNGAGSPDSAYAAFVSDVLYFTVGGQNNCFDGNTIGNVVNVFPGGALPGC